jgi:hypothetical protein
VSSLDEVRAAVKTGHNAHLPLAFRIDVHQRIGGSIPGSLLASTIGVVRETPHLRSANLDRALNPSYAGTELLGWRI